jgi:3-phenylpropionate/cinnamic acid dioxygenase small subunit
MLEQPGTVLSSGSSTYAELVDFLNLEVRLLDEWRWDEWLELLHPEIAYSMPVRLSVMPKDGQGFVEGMDYYADDLSSLKTRIARLHTDQAWAEQPGSRTRHMLSNMWIEETGADAWLVKSNFLVTRARADHMPDLFSGERHDVVVRTDGRLLLKQRTILLDQSVLKSYNLSIFF